MTIPQDVLERTPLMTEAGFSRFLALQQHPRAPIWNHVLGDRIGIETLTAAQAFRTQPLDPEHPWLRPWLGSMAQRSWWFAHHVRDVWDDTPTMSRGALAESLHLVVPTDADFTELLTYTTSGTTGHALNIPSHPVSLAKNQTLAERALAAWGITIDFGANTTAVQVCDRLDTFQFVNVFAVWNQCGFAKVNLRDHAWRGGLDDARAFLEQVDPVLVTGDPTAFAALAALAPAIRPRAMFSTATALDPTTLPHLEVFGCPIIDWYSCTETGPIAFKNPAGQWRFFAPDLKIEVLDDHGRVLGPGELGHVAVTGGRNPYLPLLRYLTGDRATLSEDGAGFAELHGRQEVFFQTPNGVLQGIDLTRAMREADPFYQHHILQRRDGSFDVTVRPILGVTNLATLGRVLEQLTGATVRMRADAELGRESKTPSCEVES